MKTTRRAALGILASLPATMALARPFNKPKKIRVSVPTRSPRALTPKLGIIYPFARTAEIEKAIATGWAPQGQYDYKFRDATTTPSVTFDSNGAKLKLGIDNLVGSPNLCTFIATIGALRVFEHLRGHIGVNFVSLVGGIPASRPMRCRGGLSLEIVENNGARIGRITDVLTDLKGDPSNIYLYRHALPTKGQVATAIDIHWPNPGTIREVSADGFNADLNGISGAMIIPATARGLVLHASPFFLANRDLLVGAVDTWLKRGDGGAKRHVVYPLQDFFPVATPHTDSTCLGPNLMGAIAMLGTLARARQEDGGQLPIMPVTDQTFSRQGPISS
jgi:hypothetical protein